MARLATDFIRNRSSSSFNRVFRSRRHGVYWSRPIYPTGKGGVTPDERTESNNGTRFVCKPSLNGRQKHTNHSPDTDTSDSPVALAHRSLPLTPASLSFSLSLLTLSFSALAIWRLAEHGNQHELRQIRTPHTNIRGFIWGFWLEDARKRLREHRVVLPPVTGTATTPVETHFKVAGYVAGLIRLLSDFANWGSS